MFSDFSFSKDKSPWFVTLLLIAVAYYLSFWVRLEWIDFARLIMKMKRGSRIFSP